jgi:hypothetical protein
MARMVYLRMEYSFLRNKEEQMRGRVNVEREVYGRWRFSYQVNTFRAISWSNLLLQRFCCAQIHVEMESVVSAIALPGMQPSQGQAWRMSIVKPSTIVLFWKGLAGTLRKGD